MDEYGSQSPPTPPAGWPVHPGDRPPVREGAWLPPEPPAAGSPPPAGPAGPVASPAPPQRGGRNRAGLGFLVGLLVALMVGGVGFAIGRNQSTNSATPIRPTTQAVVTTPRTSSGGTTSWDSRAAGSLEPAEAVAKALSPAVVQIETQSGLGSGFIYDTDGHILTASHVVDGFSTVTVRLADGTTKQGKVLGEDTGTDVAVVKIPSSSSLPVAQLAVDQNVQVGQTAIAIGSPFGLDQTVTAGIVSAVGRSSQTPGGAIPMIQTDAPINPGNSGGALANRDGAVIGINDSIASDSGSNSGVGFAIPISTAKTVADKLVKGEPIQTAALGVSLSDSQTGAGTNGALVTQVLSGSAADKAGIQEGDVVTAIDNKPIAGNVDLAADVRSHQPGDKVMVTITRNGSSKDIKVTLGKSSH